VTGAGRPAPQGHERGRYVDRARGPADPRHSLGGGGPGTAGWLAELEQAAREATPASTALIPHRRAWVIRIRIVNFPHLGHTPHCKASRGVPVRPRRSL